MLTGLKDLDREVLSKMDDRELLTVCQIDKRFYNEVCDDNFLRRRLLKYPGIEKYKRENETWKQFFLRSIFHIAKMKEDYDFIYISGDFEKQYELLKNYHINFLLLEASSQGELDLVKYALKKGVSIHYNDELPLRLATAYGRTSIVKYLVENGADIHIIDDIALIIASKEGYLDIVKYLVEKGANIHTINDDALNKASENGHLDVVKYLVEKGANINPNDVQPLTLASLYGYFDIVKYLVEKGAIIHDKAIKYARDHKIAEYLENKNRIF